MLKIYRVKHLLQRRRGRLGLWIAGALAVSFWLVCGNGVAVGPGEKQDNIDLEVGLWTEGTTIEQTFIASQNNLCRIDFRLDSYFSWDSPYLEFHLYEIESELAPPKLSYEFMKTHRKEVRSGRVNGWLLSPHMINAWNFTPLQQSKEKRYLLSIRSPELKKGGTSILLASPIDRYLYFGELFVDGERKDGDLAFRLLYQQPRLIVLQKIAARLALQKPILFSAPWVFYGLAIIYLMLLVLFVYKLLQI